MAIHYKLIQRPEPGVTGSGIKKWYASLLLKGEVTIDDLVKSIEKFSSLSEPDIRGVIVALENVIENELANSKIVRLETLGSLYPALSRAGVDNKEDFTHTEIRRVSVRYRPGKRILDSVRAAGLKREAEF